MGWPTISKEIGLLLALLTGLFCRRSKADLAHFCSAPEGWNPMSCHFQTGMSSGVDGMTLKMTRCLRGVDDRRAKSQRARVVDIVPSIASPSLTDGRGVNQSSFISPQPMLMQNASYLPSSCIPIPASRVISARKTPFKLHPCNHSTASSHSSARRTSSQSLLSILSTSSPSGPNHSFFFPPFSSAKPNSSTNST